MLTIPLEVMALIAMASSLAVYGLLVIVYIEWQRIHVDIARSRLFAARDDVFIAFAESDLGLDHPAHRLVREYFNRSIRSAHRLTIWQVIFAHAAGWTSPPPPLKVRLRAMLENHPDLLRRAVFQLDAGSRALKNLLISRSVLVLLPAHLLGLLHVVATPSRVERADKEIGSFVVTSDHADQISYRAKFLRAA
jgi:hypothetical protein